MKCPFELSTIEQLKDLLINDKKTLSVAESVTAGALQMALSQAPMASQFFQGGLTAYNLGQKTKLLGIEPIFAMSCNCVDAGIAEKMALQSNQLFLSDYAIGITGYATRVPEMGIDTLFAYIAIAKGNEIIASVKAEPGNTIGQDNAYAIQLYYTNYALSALLLKLKSNP
jgi:nicotinamide-nucleotide amidase